MMATTHLRIAIPFVALACAGCPGKLENPERFLDAGDDGTVVPVDDGGGGEAGDGGCPDVPNDIFAKVCGTAGCHGAMNPSNGLDLASPNVGSRLLCARATGGSGYLIDPTDPKASVLYEKLTATPPFDSRMPLGGQLDDATIACVLAYISTQTGALQSCDAGAPITDAGGD
jgi:hypothetical protein